MVDIFRGAVVILEDGIGRYICKVLLNLPMELLIVLFLLRI